MLGQLRIVRNHDDAFAALMGQPSEDRNHLLRGMDVQIAGRLVGNDDLAAGREGAGDGHALLLAAGEQGSAELCLLHVDPDVGEQADLWYRIDPEHRTIVPKEAAPC